MSTWVREPGSVWAYRTVLAAHTVGMSLLVGANAALDLRLLGVAPQVPLAAASLLLWTGAITAGRFMAYLTPGPS